MAITPLPALRIADIFMKDGHSAKLNENSFFRFLSYDLLYLQFTGDTAEWVSPTKKKIIQIYREYAKLAETSELWLWLVIFWVMVDFVFKIHRKIDQVWVQKRLYFEQNFNEKLFIHLAKTLKFWWETSPTTPSTGVAALDPACFWIEDSSLTG